MPYESNKAYDYLLQYLELGVQRNINKLYNTTKKNEKTKISRTKLTEYKNKYMWNERAEQYDTYQNEKKQRLLKEECNTYFDKKRKELELYEDIYQSVTAGILEGILDEKIDPIKASHALKELSEANIDMSKFHLRLYGEPADIQQINNKQEIKIEDENEYDLLDPEWMDNELEIMKQIIQKP